MLARGAGQAVSIRTVSSANNEQQQQRSSMKTQSQSQSRSTKRHQVDKRLSSCSSLLASSACAASGIVHIKTSSTTSPLKKPSSSASGAPLSSIRTLLHLQQNNCINNSVFDLLPVEVKLNIFRFLSPSEVMEIAGVCTEWRDLIHKEPTSRFLWKEIYELMFGGPKSTEVSFKKASLEVVAEMKKRFRADSRPDFSSDSTIAGQKLCWASRYGHHQMAARHLNVWGSQIVNGWYLQQESQLLASPLFLAAQEGQMKVLSLLLKYGAAVNSAAEDDGSTPLLIATQGQHVAAVETLLAHGADSNATRGDGVTPLYIACQNGYTELVEPLLRYKADVRLPVTADGATPLFISSQNGHYSAVKYLLQYGAQPDIPRTDGVTSLFIAAQNGHKDVVELLLTRADINNAAFHGATALFIACFKGNLEVVRLLLQRRANVNLACDDGATPLFISSKNGRREIVELLLRSTTADVNATYYDGSTPLIAAAEKGDLAIVQLLLQHGANRTLARVDGQTAFSIATLNRHEQVMNLLRPEDGDEEDEVEEDEEDEEGTEPMDMTV
jgi:ankyrin repeat protein